MAGARDRRPLRVAVLVSATGSNLRTLLELQRRDPDLLEVVLVASHGRQSPALDVAREAGIPTWPGDFDEVVGRRSDARSAAQLADYEARALDWHDGLDQRIQAWEGRHGALDLVVLAYHRLIQGSLLARFSGRMINMHPADLSILEDGRRSLTGNDPVRAALRAGHSSTRTSCFMVDETLDGGAVICMGPMVPVQPGRDARAHEFEQKHLSDAPALTWAVTAIAHGWVRLGEHRHEDGSSQVLFRDEPLPLGGHVIDAEPAAQLSLPSGSRQ